MKNKMKQYLLSSFFTLWIASLPNLVHADIVDDTEVLLNWAENSFPQYFSSHEITQSIDPWMFRFYPETNVYAGVNSNDNGVYVFGGPWGTLNPTFVDTLSNLLLAQSVNGKLTDISSIANGYITSSNYSLALKNNGTVLAWGQNFKGVLGDGTEIDSTTPVHVLGLTEIIRIVKGTSSSYALKSDGTIWAWGSNFTGKLGDGTRIDSFIPVQVIGLTDVIDITTNGNSIYALKTDGTIWAWGKGDNAGLLGIEDGTQDNSQVFSIPIKVNSLENVSAIVTPPNDSDANNLVAIKHDGTVWVLGENTGNGTSKFYHVPVQASGLTDVISVVFAGDNRNNIYALKKDGTVWAWGDNESGQLGDGTTTSSFFPVQVSHLENVVSIAAGVGSGYALKGDGTLWSWGSNMMGQLGDGTTTVQLVPVQVTGLSDIVSVIPNNSIFSYVIALKKDGTVWAWGNNQNGQLGNGTTEISEDFPIQVNNLHNIVSISVSYTSNFAVQNDGTVWAWGYNYLGQLGDGTTEDRLFPVQVVAPK